VLEQGIPVKDKEGATLGMSQEAAKTAVFQGAITRAVIHICAYIYMYVYIYRHIHVCIYVYTYAHI